MYDCVLKHKQAQYLIVKLTMDEAHPQMEATYNIRSNLRRTNEITRWSKMDFLFYQITSSLKFLDLIAVFFIDIYIGI